MTPEEREARIRELPKLIEAEENPIKVEILARKLRQLLSADDKPSDITGSALAAELKRLHKPYALKIYPPVGLTDTSAVDKEERTYVGPWISYGLSLLPAAKIISS